MDLGGYGGLVDNNHAQKKHSGCYVSLGLSHSVLGAMG